MNMNKALQNLYHAVSGSTTTKVNISKLLVDIHYAITGKESENKNNWSRIINSMADNWPEGGGGITIEALSVTENDIYTAPEGKAYSPVTVNVSGGSSDFSTATVTIVVNSGAFTDIYGAFYDEDEFGPYTYASINSAAVEKPLNIILYKGFAFLYMSNAANITAVGTGSITISENLYCDITGDCTITISPK